MEGQLNEGQLNGGSIKWRVRHIDVTLRPPNSSIRNY